MPHEMIYFAWFCLPTKLLTRRFTEQNKEALALPKWLYRQVLPRYPSVFPLVTRANYMFFIDKKVVYKKVVYSAAQKGFQSKVLNFLMPKKVYQCTCIKNSVFFSK